MRHKFESVLYFLCRRPYFVPLNHNKYEPQSENSDADIFYDYNINNEADASSISTISGYSRYIDRPDGQRCQKRQERPERRIEHLALAPHIEERQRQHQRGLSTSRSETLFLSSTPYAR